MKDFSFLTHRLEQRKALVWGLLQSRTLEVSNLVMCSWSNHQKCLCFQIKRLLGSDRWHVNWWKTLWDKLICVFIWSYCVTFACDYDEARDNFSSRTLLELMCFKLSLLSYYDCFCYGISVIKTVMIHLIYKSNFILADHKTCCKSLQ